MSRDSLQADLANAQSRNARLNAHVQQLEKRLCQAMAVRLQELVLGAPTDSDEFQRRIARVEQQKAELTSVLEDARAGLDAAQVTNRDPTRSLKNADSTTAGCTKAHRDNHGKSSRR
ncbi:hypothetical protein [Streptomyces nigrescens]|uniref:hypothetical protein n=1 Tax=Streptomyces nigrescens TaxID=1920 RepID=UPI0036FFB6FA